MSTVQQAQGVLSTVALPPMLSQNLLPFKAIGGILRVLGSHVDASLCNAPVEIVRCLYTSLLGVSPLSPIPMKLKVQSLLPMGDFDSRTESFQNWGCLS